MTRPLPSVLAAALLALALCPLGAFAGTEGAARAPGGASILAASRNADAVVAGVVSHARRVDLHGWAADLSVDQVLLGKAKVGQVIAIAWEELAEKRAARFADGERVLVLLEPLPSQSLWRKRFPDATARASMRAVAAEGNAFVVSPDGATMNALVHYLALASDARSGAPGQVRLADLAASASPGISAEAMGMLEAVQGPVAPEAATLLLRLAMDEKRDVEVRAQALRLAARRDTPEVRAVAQKLASEGSSMRAEATLVLAGMPGGLAPAQVDALLASSDAQLRAVGARSIPLEGSRPRLEKLMREDQAGVVRLAAARELIGRFGASAIPTVMPLLEDPDPPVRATAAGIIGTLGPVAMDPLLKVIDSGPPLAAMAAVVGLVRTGKDAGPALARIAETHPDERVRAYARVAVGKPIGHTHDPKDAKLPHKGHADEDKPDEGKAAAAPK